jgi:hypothetical protein
MPKNGNQGVNPVDSPGAMLSTGSMFDSGLSTHEAGAGALATLPGSVPVALVEFFVIIRAHITFSQLLHKTALFPGAAGVGVGWCHRVTSWFSVSCGLKSSSLLPPELSIGGIYTADKAQQRAHWNRNRKKGQNPPQPPFAKGVGGIYYFQ